MITQLSARSTRARRSFGASAAFAGMPARLAALLSFVPVRMLLAVVVLAVGSGLGVAHAQATAHFSGVVTTLGGGFSNPESVAVDGSGNVYVADSRFLAGQLDSITKMPAGCASSSCVTVLADGINGVFGLAVDGDGNVYFAETGRSYFAETGTPSVKEIPVGCVSSSCVITLGGGFSSPAGVAVDGSGNVYVAEAGAEHSNFYSSVKEIPSGCVSSSCVTTLGGGFNGDQGVAVDAGGNVYVADSSNSEVKEMPAGCASSSCVTTLGGGFDQPVAVAVDASGNVYVADTYHNAVKVMPAGCASASCVTTIGGGFRTPTGVAVDKNGLVYVADFNNGAVKEISLQGLNFQSVAVGATGTAQTLYFTVDSAGTLGTPLVLTQGAQNLDFTDAGTGTCTTNGAAYTYSGGDTCTVDVVFSPKFAGTRDGAVVLVDANGAPIATVNIYGTGLGPQIAFSPATQTTLIGSGLSFPYSPAVDGSGNIYIADSGTNRVLKETLSAGGYIQTTVGSGFENPQGVAVDGAGNVYVADSLSGRVLLETPSGGSYTQTTFASGVFPGAVAVDGVGNVYIADQLNGSVLRETLSGGSYAQSTIASGLNQPQGLAADASGNVYIADSSNNRVLKETLSGGSYIETTIGSGLSNPKNVSVDGNGNVYIADADNNRVLAETLSGGIYTQTTIGSGLSNPNGVAVDGSGNVYIGDTYNNRVVEENVATPPALTFAATAVGQTSSDSPQSVQVQNIGNQPLNAVPPGLSVGANFAQVAGSGTPADCTTGFSLAPGAACDLSISFTPTTVGQISSSAVLTDNHLNATPSAMQTVPLSGTGNLAPAIGFSVASQTYGAAPFAVAATSNSTGVFTYSVVSGPATISGSTVTLTGAGSVTLMASQAASGNYAAGSSNATFTVASATPAIGFSVASQTYGAAPFAVAATSNSTGAFTYSVVSGPATVSGSTVTLTGAGSVTLMASQAAAGNYAAGSSNATFTVASATPSIGFSVANQTYGAAPSTVAATSNSTGAFTYSVVSGPATVSGNTVTLTGAGSVTLMASQAASGNYAAGSSNATFTVASATPSVSFSVANQTYGAAPFPVAATSNSTGAFTYSVVSGPATVSGSTVTIIGAGSVTLMASQAAAGNYAAGASNATFTVVKAGSTISLGGVTNATGNTATLTATVGSAAMLAAGDVGPSGMVTFSNASGNLGTATLVKGVATLTTPAYTGLQSFTATYNGDTNFINSATSNTVALNFTVNPSITFTIQGSYVYGQSFSVKATSNSSGAITYSLVSGPATVNAAGTVTVTGEGTVTVQTSQAAAPGYNMYSQTASFTATQASSATKLTATAGKSGYSPVALLTATVSPQYTGNPTGSVTFYDGTTKLTTVTLSGGTATYTTPQLVGVSHSFSATYTGDSNFVSSNSNTASLTIPATAVSLQLAATKLVYPLPPAFAIKIGTGSSPAPTGTVSIYDGTTIVATYPLYAVTQGNLFGLVLPPLNVGTHMLEAVYSGDANHAPGQSAFFTVTVVPGPVMLSLSCTGTKLVLGQKLTCTVNAGEGPLPVVGTVNYTVTGWGSGSVTLNKLGQAAITYLVSSRGTFILTATYAAQGNYQAAQPANVTFTIN